jgi:transposase
MLWDVRRSANLLRRNSKQSDGAPTPTPKDVSREEAQMAGHKIARIAIAFESGRDGFWLARWLETQGIEAYVIHASSVAVSREHRRAKTDRLDTEMLKRAFVGWLRGEREHCKMVAIPDLQTEDAKRPSRERKNLVAEQNRIINRMKAALIRLGIRGFNPKLKKAVDRLADLRIGALSARASFPRGSYFAQRNDPTLWETHDGFGTTRSLITGRR